MAGTSPVGTWVDPDNTTQAGAAYKGNLDADHMVAKRVAARFAPHAKTSPDMTIQLDPGFIFIGVTLTEVALQTTSAFVAPVSNPRIDRIVCDNTTGVYSRVAGAEAGSPVAPAIPAGKFPVARVLLTVGMTTITDSSITDERALPASTGSGTSSPVVIASGTQAAAAEGIIDLTGQWATYSVIEIYLTEILISAGDDLQAVFRTGAGDYTTGAYAWAYTFASWSASTGLGGSGAATDTKATLIPSVNGSYMSLKLRLTQDPSGHHQLLWEGQFKQNAANRFCAISGAADAATGATNTGISIKPSAGTVAFKWVAVGIPKP